MRRRRAPTEVIGLSFLDMICCAFGGVLVLYLLAQRVERKSNPVPVAAHVIEASVESNRPFGIGLKFSWDGTEYACWRECRDAAGGRVQWIRSPGSIAAILRGKAAQPTEVQVALIDGRHLLERDCVEIAIHSGLRTTFPLHRKDGFRGRATLPPRATTRC